MQEDIIGKINMHHFAGKHGTKYTCQILASTPPCIPATIKNALYFTTLRKKCQRPWVFDDGFCYNPE